MVLDGASEEHPDGVAEKTVRGVPRRRRNCFENSRLSGGSSMQASRPTDPSLRPVWNAS
jgi:hypothetical protein